MPYARRDTFGQLLSLHRQAEPEAQEYLNDDAPEVLAFVVSGALAGLAGSVEFTGVTYALYDNFSPGYGFTAIAVALLARLNPVGVLATALLFGALEAGANAMQRDAGVPSVVVSVVEATLILLVVAAERWQSRAVARAESGT